MDVDRLMAILPTLKNRSRSRNRRRGRREKRPSRTPTELVRYLIEKEIRTTGQLRQRRQPGDPTVYDCLKAFGSWKECQIAAFGRPLPFTAPAKPSAEYLVNTVLQLDIWKRKDWCEARKKNPTLIPSISQVRRVFHGRFSNLIVAAERMSLRKTLERYLVLARRLDRVPTTVECKRHDIDLGPLAAIYANKREFDDTLVHGLLFGKPKIKETKNFFDTKQQIRHPTTA